MPARSSGAPRRRFLYSDVAARLRARIARNVYPPGERLPSLADLMQEFEVSAITVRRAVSELVYEGLVRGHQGRGVFVKEKPKIHRVLVSDPRRSIGEEIARAGFTPEIRELGFARVAAEEVVAARLGIARGAPVYLHQKITLADGEPVALHTLHLRPQVAQRLRADLSREFIFRLLKQRGMALDALNFEFSAVSLCEEYARLIGLPAGQAMLRIDFTVQARSGSPLMLGLTLCRADRFVFEVSVPAHAFSQERSARRASSAGHRD